MDYVKSYKNFINGRHFSEGIRITAGILLPTFVMLYLNELGIGIVASVGALCVSVTDSPGPPKHRINGMLICIFLVGIVSIATGYLSASPLFLGILIAVFGFIFSMLTVYGVRSSSIGIASLLVMILSLQTPLHGKEVWLHSLYILAGGIWYLLFSILLYRIRPYKAIQQILGDFIDGVAVYLKTRGYFYVKKPDYDKIYHELLQQQIYVQNQQNLLSELLFKTRTIVKESTHIGRVILKLYLDAADLFEGIMTTYQEYTILHKQFDETGILEKYHQHIISLAEELEAIALAVKSGERSISTKQNIKNIKQTREYFETLRLNHMTRATVENFVSIGRILHNLEQLAEKIDNLHYFTTYDKKIKKLNADKINPEDYTDSQDIRVSIFFSNLSFNSGIFRHSIRVSLALLLGYVISLFFKIGHSYWILLTIVVILKPAYSLTKTRNKDRLFGTFLGILTGMGILFFIKNNTVLLVSMVFFMTAGYSFIRKNYFLGVLFMTPYLLIFSHLLYPGTLKIVLTDRLLDTAIGCVISFIASLFFVPAWEHTTIKSFMVKILEGSKNYFNFIAKAFTNNDPLNIQDFKKLRREVLISLANLSDAFSRMLSEPKRYQKGMELVHRFVVLNYMLTSHLATLAYYLTVSMNKYRSTDLQIIINQTDINFNNGIQCLESKPETILEIEKEKFKKLNDQVGLLSAKRKEEITKGLLDTETKQLFIEAKSVIDQFNYIFNLTSDIAKICRAYK